MKSLDNWEYGRNNTLLYTLTLSMLHPITGINLQLSDLYLTMHIRDNITDDVLFSVIGTLNSTTDKFEFKMSQEQANLMTVGTWIVGIETKLTDIDGQVLNRESYSRKIIQTGAKG